MGRLSRRAAIATAGLVPLSGCAKVLVKGAKVGDDAVRGADEAAKGADEVAKGVDDGAKIGDDVARSGDEAAKGADESKEGSDAADLVEYGAEVVPSPTPTATQPKLGDSDFTLPETFINTTADIESGYYVYWELSYSDLVDQETSVVEFEYEILVQSGGPVDILLLPSTEFTHYATGKRYQYYSALSAFGTSEASATVELPLEDYVFVVDNATGSTQPRGPVTVSVNITGVPQ